VVATGTTIILVAIINQILLTIKCCFNITFGNQNRTVISSTYKPFVWVTDEYNILFLLNTNQNIISTSKISKSNSLIMMLPQ